MNTKLNIILPIYNPHDGWEKKLITYFLEFRNCVSDLVECQLIMVNDGSNIDLSKTIEIIQRAFPSSQYIHNAENHGKGHAIRTGANHAYEGLVMYTDYDFPYQVECMVDMLSQFIEKDLNICIAKRDNTYYKQAKGPRNVISKVLKMMNKIIMRLPVSDTQGGLKIFDQEVAEILRKTSTNRYLIDIELLKSVHKVNIEITSFNVRLREGIKLTNTSNMHLLKELRSYFKILIS